MAKVNKKFCKTKKNKEKFICRNRVLAIYVFLKNEGCYDKSRVSPL